MALSEQDLQAITKSVLESLTPALGEIVGKTVDGKITELNERAIAPLAEKISGIDLEGGFDRMLDRLIEEADSLSVDDSADDDYTYGPDEDDTPVSNRPDPAILRAQKELEELKAQMQQERQAREQAERQAQRQRLENEVVSRISDSVLPGKASELLKLLEVSGKLAEENGQLVVKGRDQYGEISKPLTEALPTLLQSDYSHYALGRGGTGTGAAPGNSSTPAVEFDPNAIAGAYKGGPQAMEAALKAAAEAERASKGG